MQWAAPHDRARNPGDPRSLSTCRTELRLVGFVAPGLCGHAVSVARLAAAVVGCLCARTIVIGCGPAWTQARRFRSAVSGNGAAGLAAAAYRHWHQRLLRLA